MTALKTVAFGRPLNDLPESSSRHSYGPAAHWEAVATHCRQHPNLWMPVTITGMGKTSAAQAASDIRNAKRVSFRTGSWDAAARDGQLYVRYNTIAKAA